MSGGKPSPEMAWALHFARYQSAQQNGAPTGTIPRTGDWTCPKCRPKTIVFATKNECFKCKTPKPTAGNAILGVAPPSHMGGIKFAVRGDSLLQLRNDTGSKNAKKFRNFKSEFEDQFWNVFGECSVDHTLSVGLNIRDVTQSIAIGDFFDILCVGVGIQDLLDPHTWDVLHNYPASLDQDLEALAQICLSKAKNPVIMVGGPAQFWDRPPRWDIFLAQARNTLRRAGVPVVPCEHGADLIQQMTLSTDGMHFANNESQKELFVKTWAQWLLAAAQDKSFGRTITNEAPAIGPVFATVRHDRSRSPPRRQPTQQWSGMASHGPFQLYR